VGGSRLGTRFRAAGHVCIPLGEQLPNARLVGMAGRFLADVGREVVAYAAPGFHPTDGPEPASYHRWLADAAHRSDLVAAR
jgi:hypothetical protein